VSDYFPPRFPPPQEEEGDRPPRKIKSTLISIPSRPAFYFSMKSIFACSLFLLNFTFAVASSLQLTAEPIFRVTRERSLSGTSETVFSFEFVKWMREEGYHSPTLPFALDLLDRDRPTTPKKGFFRKGPKAVSRGCPQVRMSCSLYSESFSQRTRAPPFPRSPPSE